MPTGQKGRSGSPLLPKEVGARRGRGEREAGHSFGLRPTVCRRTQPLAAIGLTAESGVLESSCQEVP